jgi:hypothetical protein
MTTTYPRIPTFPPQAADEAPRDLGLRAFRFLLTENLSAVLLSTSVLDQALSASQLVIAAPDMAESARARFTSLRFEIASTLENRRREEAIASRSVAASAPMPKPKSGGHASRLQPPVPVRPSPSAAQARPF